MNHVETGDHLFFKCSWVQVVLVEVQKWLTWKWKGDDLQSLFRWFRRSKVSLFRKQVILAGVAALVYSIWQARNLYIWTEECFELSKIVSQVKWSVKNRVTLVKKRTCNCVDEDWFDML